MHDSRSKTGGPYATQGAIVVRQQWREDDGPRRLTTTRVGSSGDVIERVRKWRIVDLRGYHDAIGGVKKHLLTRGLINPEVMNVSVPPQENNM